MFPLSVLEGDIVVKECAKCGENKSLNKYHKNASMPDGLHFYCKPCHNRYAGERRIESRARLAEARNVEGFVKDMMIALDNAGIGPSQLAKQVGLKSDTITSWIKGLKNPHPKTQVMVAEHLDIRLDCKAFVQDADGSYPDGMGQCPECSTRFPTYRKLFNRYCSDQCKNTAQSTRQFGAENPAYKEGRKLTDEGYVDILVGRDHPMAKRSGYALEHRIVMSELLGRPLKRAERVHHINGVRDDNRPDNLELWVPSGSRTEHPNGIRLVDSVMHEMESLRPHELERVLAKAKQLLEPQE